MSSGINSGSFKDPAGVVFHTQDGVFRALSARGEASFRPVLDSNLLAAWQQRGVAVATEEVSPSFLPDHVRQQLGFEPALVLQHRPIEYISYPYEWPFALLKKAALLHLELQIEALEAGFSFTDSSAYNIQFSGAQPILMDVLSVRPYREGEYWSGYRQFCEEFLNPLLLSAKLGVSYASWYRGNLSGISVEDIARILPFKNKLSLSALVHVELHARLVRSTQRSMSHERSLKVRPLSQAAYGGMLKNLRSWVLSLRPKGVESSYWADYDRRNSYEPGEARVKKNFVREYVGRRSPKLLLDLGCNSGDYSQLALEGGARSVVAFDLDQGALEAAVVRAESQSLNLLPLFLDITNPSPNQGWRQRERMGYRNRSNPDTMIALALIHHLVIGKNIPLGQAVQWLVGCAPSGVIEFVPKQDPMVQGMLSAREDIFSDYNLDQFRAQLQKHARIVKEAELSESGRVMFEYEIEGTV